LGHLDFYKKIYKVIDLQTQFDLYFRNKKKSGLGKVIE
jgi:hypothetical protein